MIRSNPRAGVRAVLLSLLSVFTLLSGPAFAAEKRVLLGVCLPTSITDGQERFAFAEKLGAKLEKALGAPVTVRNFGRYEDFAKAANGLDYALVESWLPAGNNATAVAIGKIDGRTSERWAVAGKTKRPLVELGGKKLAITKGGVEAQFLTNVVFGGDLSGDKHFKLMQVPSVESALKALEVGSAELALMPAAHIPKGVHVLFRSNPVPRPALLSIKGNAARLTEILPSLAGTAPFDDFTPLAGEELSSLRRMITAGPPARQPVMAESAVQRFDSNAVIKVGELGLVLPPFLDLMQVASEQPDD